MELASCDFFSVFNFENALLIPELVPKNTQDKMKMNSTNGKKPCQLVAILLQVTTPSIKIKLWPQFPCAVGALWCGTNFGYSLIDWLLLETTTSNILFVCFFTEKGTMLLLSFGHWFVMNFEPNMRKEVWHKPATFFAVTATFKKQSSQIFGIFKHFYFCSHVFLCFNFLWNKHFGSRIRQHKARSQWTKCRSFQDCMCQTQWCKHFGN